MPIRRLSPGLVALAAWCVGPLAAACDDHDLDEVIVFEGSCGPRAFDTAVPTVGTSLRSWVNATYLSVPPGVYVIESDAMAAFEQRAEAELVASPEAGKTYVVAYTVLSADACGGILEEARLVRSEDARSLVAELAVHDVAALCSTSCDTVYVAAAIWELDETFEATQCTRTRQTCSD